MDMTKNLGAQVAWLSKPTISKFFSFVLHDYFMPIDHGVKKKTPASASIPLPPSPYQICLLFYKKHFINLLLH